VVLANAVKEGEGSRHGRRSGETEECRGRFRRCSELTLGSSPLSYFSCVLSLTHPRSTCRRHRQHPLSSLCRSTFVPSATTRLDKMRCQSIYSRRKGEDRYEGRLFACDRLPEVAERAREGELWLVLQVGGRQRMGLYARGEQGCGKARESIGTV
jgi:hypothetical protein